MTAVIFIKLCCRRWRLSQRLADDAQVGSPNSGLTDSIMDKYLTGNEIHIPPFEHSIFHSMRNKLRMSYIGILDLETGAEDLHFDKR